MDYWTSREVREVERSHLNYVVADTMQWEQSAAYIIDTHRATDAFVKNAGLGFYIPYIHNGQRHDYTPDFLVRLKADGDAPRHLILETKGYDLLEEKSAPLPNVGWPRLTPMAPSGNGNTGWPSASLRCESILTV